MNGQNPSDWPQAWQRMPQDRRDTITRILRHYGALIPSYRPDDPVPDPEAFNAIAEWQNLENEILTAHVDWLARTKALFERRGWPWTTAELLARSHVREVGE